MLLAADCPTSDLGWPVAFIITAIMAGLVAICWIASRDQTFTVEFPDVEDDGDDT